MIRISLIASECNILSGSAALIAGLSAQDYTRPLPKGNDCLYNILRLEGDDPLCRKAVLIFHTSFTRYLDIGPAGLLWKST